MMHLIFGTKGTGKTTLGQYLLAKHKGPRLVIDPIGEHKGELICNSFRELLNACQTGRAENKKSIVLRRFGDAEDYSDQIFQFCQKLRGWCVFVDEVDRFCSAVHLPKSFDDFLNGQRHYGVDIICASRRPAKVHNDVTSLTDTLWLFRMIGVSDLEYVRQTAGRKIAERVKVLPNHEFLEMSFPLYAWD